MHIAIGLKARIGRAVLVAVGGDASAPRFIKRAEIRLLPEGAFAPYHTAKELEPEAAQESARGSIAAANQLAKEAIGASLKRLTAAGHKITGCGVLIGNGMPDWTVEEILVAHVRMHKAEGELFRTALIQGAKAHKLSVKTLPHKTPFDAAAKVLGLPRSRLDVVIAALGKQAGPPWGHHQREAAAAALTALSAGTMAQAAGCYKATAPQAARPEITIGTSFRFGVLL
jgi:hypothetical protein